MDRTTKGEARGHRDVCGDRIKGAGDALSLRRVPARRVVLSGMDRRTVDAEFLNNAQRGVLRGKPLPIC